MKTRSIGRLITLMLATLVLAVSVAFAAVFLMYLDDQLDALSELGTSKTHLMRTEIEKWLGRKEAVLDTLRYPIAERQGEFDFYKQIFWGISESDEDIIEVYFGTKSSLPDGGHFQTASGWTPPEGWDHTGRPWFTAAVDAGSMIRTAPYIDASTGELVISLARPVNAENGVLAGVLGLDMYITQVAKTVAQETITESGASYLVKSDGTYITNPNEGAVLERTLFDDFELSDDARAVVTGNQSRMSIDRSSGLYVASAPFQGIDWTLVSVGPLSDVNAQMYGFVAPLAAVALIAIAIAVAIPFVIARLVARPVRELATVADSYAEGNLGIAVNARFAERYDEIGVLSRSFVRMSGQLQSIVADVRNSADSVSSGAHQVSGSSQSLSDGAAQQASSAEQVSSSMEEMDANIKHNAENATETKSIASQAASDAEKSGEAVRGTVEAMRTISERIAVVEEIARQTNLLALNAAIEAARAGESGKGFAVVASEVRKLAERSQKAAGEITDLSSSSVEIAETAGQRIEGLIPRIRQTAELVTEIESASREQSQGADQINKALAELDGVIQRNASASEEMASTAEELASQAEHLQQAIQFFNLSYTDSVPQLTAPRERAAPTRGAHRRSGSELTGISLHGMNGNEFEGESRQVGAGSEEEFEEY